MKEKVQKLVEALKRTNEAALAEANTNDSGTCNFDTPLICLKGWKSSDIKEASESAGIEIGEQLSGWHKGYRFVSVKLYGQANRRTLMAEAAKRSLVADGYDASMYYQMD